MMAVEMRFDIFYDINMWGTVVVFFDITTNFKQIDILYTPSTH